MKPDFPSMATRKMIICPDVIGYVITFSENAHVPDITGTGKVIPPLSRKGTDPTRYLVDPGQGVILPTPTVSHISI